MEAKKANDCDCIKCGEKADVFWPVVDIDITPHPYCKRCVGEEQLKLIIALNEVDEKNKRE